MLLDSVSVSMFVTLFGQIPIGAENVGVGADDLEELASDEDEYFRLGQEDEDFKDYSSLKLKADHQNRYHNIFFSTSYECSLKL